MYGDQFGEFVCGYWGLQEFTENVRTFFPQGQSKLLEIMRCLCVY